MNYRVGIITASDKGFRGERIDESGPEIKRIVEMHGLEVVSEQILEDDTEQLRIEMIRLADQVECDLILTTGGTGLSMRDVTPEATLSVIEKQADGISEAIRAYSMTITKRAMLSRGISGIRNQTLIVNLPGSPKAVSESLTYIISELIHGLDVLKNNVSECARDNT